MENLWASANTQWTSIIKPEEYVKDSEHYSSGVSDDEDTDFKPTTQSVKLQWEMRIKLKATALNSNQYEVLDQSTAAIVFC